LVAEGSAIWTVLEDSSKELLDIMSDIHSAIAVVCTNSSVSSPIHVPDSLSFSLSLQNFDKLLSIKVALQRTWHVASSWPWKLQQF
jgi:hypothetical protein